MKISLFYVYLILAALPCSPLLPDSLAAESTSASAKVQSVTTLLGSSVPAATGHRTDRSASAAINSVVIIPLRAADIPTEVKGVISAFHFDKGDMVKKDQPVVEISRERYAIMHQMAKGKLEGLKQSLHLAEQLFNVKKEIFSKNYGTRQKLLEAESEVSIIRQKVDEAKRELELARLNLDSCVVKAPFTGYIVEKYKEAHEAVNQLDKLFRIVDTHKVFAVANVPEQQVQNFKKNGASYFIDSASRRYRGSVDKVEPILCPESKTSKVFVLLENTQAQLKVGMTGALWSE